MVRHITDASLARTLATPRQTRSASNPNRPSPSFLDTLQSPEKKPRALRIKTTTSPISNQAGFGTDGANDADGDNEADGDDKANDASGEDETPAVIAPPHVPEKRKVGRPRKNPIPTYPAKTHEAGLSRNLVKVAPTSITLTPTKKRSYSKTRGRISAESTSAEPESPKRRSTRDLRSSPRTPSWKVADAMSQKSSPSARNNSSTDDSDDEAYNGVDEISESDEDEPSMERIEEKLIIESEEENEFHLDVDLPSSPVLMNGILDIAEHTNTRNSDGLFLSDIPFFEEQFGPQEGHLRFAFDLAHARSRSGTPVDSKSRPRVRFEELSSSNTSSTTSEDEIEYIPDLLLDQNSSGPGLRQLIENEENLSGGSDDSGSYWDLGESDQFELREIVSNTQSAVSSESSSCYESEDGDTTDEDLPPPRAITRTRSVLRRPSTSSIDGDTRNELNAFRRAMRPPPPRRNTPSLGSWVADPSKPIAVIDASGQKMYIIPAKKSTRNSTALATPASSNASVVNASPPTSFSSLHEDSDHERSDVSIQYRTTSSSSANLMMGGLLSGTHGMEYIRGGQILGPPEAFYPFTNINADGSIDADDDAEDDENLWDVNDIIDFGDGSSNSESEVATDTAAPSPTTASSTPVSTNITTQSMYAHLDRGLMSAFKFSQQRHRPSRSRAMLDERARQQAAAMIAMERKAIKGGRFGAANQPISPIRKQRFGRTFPKMGPPLMRGLKPITNNGHRRSKSMI